MTIAAKAERLAAELNERGRIAYGVMLSACEAGEPIDPLTSLRILQAARKSIEAFARDRVSLALADEFAMTIAEAVELRDRAWLADLFDVIVDCNERIDGSCRAILQIQTQVFGEYADDHAAPATPLS